MAGATRPLKILHVLRSPVGGLFRHVVDLARAQAARGHQVGIVADSSTGGARADAAFASLSEQLALGLTRVPMSRHVGMSDISAQRHVAQRARAADVDVLHGHGAKGGAYARLCGRRRDPGLHAAWRQPALRPQFAGRTSVPDARAGADAAHRAVPVRERATAAMCSPPRSATPRKLVRVVHNGVTAEEFTDIAPQADATDIVFIGELRMLKGVDRAARRARAACARGPPRQRNHRGRRARRRRVPSAGRTARPFRRGAFPRRDAGARGLRARRA